MAEDQLALAAYIAATNVPAGLMHNTAGMAITSTYEAMTGMSVVYAVNGMQTPSSGEAIFQVPVTGLYWCSAYANYDNGNGSNVLTALQVVDLTADTKLLYSGFGCPPGYSSQSCSGLVYGLQSHQIALYVDSAGSNLTVYLGNGDSIPFSGAFSLSLVCPL